MMLSSARGPRWGLVAALGLLAGLGCSAEAGTEEDVTASQAELVYGNWTTYDCRNGDPGSNPWSDPNTTMLAKNACEVLSVNVGGPRYWHPGKLFNGQCRIAWGSGTIFSSTYRPLQQPPAGKTYAWENYSGSLPSNAVTGNVVSDIRIPVCRWDGGGGIEPTFGKLWGGNCEFEWGNRRVVKSPPGISVLVEK